MPLVAEPSDPSRLAPEYVREHRAATCPGKPMDELAREFGLDRDSNRQARVQRESARARAPAVRQAIADATEELSRYPDGNGFALKAALAARYGVDRRRRSFSATAPTTCSSS